MIPTRSTLAFFVVLNAGSVTEAEESISNARLFLPAFFASVSDGGGRSLTKVFEVKLATINDGDISLLRSMTMVGH